MLCLGDGCEVCNPPKPTKKAAPKKQTVEQPKPPPVTDAPSMSSVKAAMRSAIQSDAKPLPTKYTDVDKTTTPGVTAAGQRIETLDTASLTDEDLDAIAVLAPILDEEQLKPIQSQLWKRRRRSDANDHL